MYAGKIVFAQVTDHLPLHTLRRLQVDNREAQRIVNPRHATRTHRMQEALRAAGCSVAIELR